MTPQELRNSILRKAIEGKLVEQRLDEGNAEDLYKLIQMEKQKLIKEGKNKKEIVLPEILSEDIPFDIPLTWKWVRLGDIGFTNIGLTYSPKDICAEKGIIVLRSSNIQNGIIDYNDIVRVNIDIPTNKMCFNGDILICARNGSKRLVGKAALIKEDGMSFGAFMAVYRCICNPYILYVINSAYFRNTLLGETGTTTINQITQDMLRNILIPLPPLEEQKRIVERIEELMPMVDKYEESWTKLEMFNKQFPVDMEKAILQYAMQGKLVEQRQEEGNAEDLYKLIQSEKQKLIKEGKIKKEKCLDAISPEEIPFDIPSTWKWVRLSSILDVRDGTHDSPKYYTNGIPFITSKNLVDGEIYFDTANLISKEDALKYNERSYVDNEDILFAMIGTIGNPVIVKKDREFCIKNVALIKNHNSLNLVVKYIYFYLFFIQNKLKNISFSSVQSFVSLNVLRNYLIPLPPLEEQKRIVERIEELLPLCKSLSK